MKKQRYILTNEAGRIVYESDTLEGAKARQEKMRLMGANFALYCETTTREKM